MEYICDESLLSNHSKLTELTLHYQSKLYTCTTQTNRFQEEFRGSSEYLGLEFTQSELLCEAPHELVEKMLRL